MHILLLKTMHKIYTNFFQCPSAIPESGKTNSSQYLQSNSSLVYPYNIFTIKGAGGFMKPHKCHGLSIRYREKESYRSLNFSFED